MKLFDELNINEAVKMGDKYVVHLHGSYRVNGEDVTVYQRQVAFSSLRKLLKGRIV